MLFKAKFKFNEFRTEAHVTKYTSHGAIVLRNHVDSKLRIEFVLSAERSLEVEYKLANYILTYKYLQINSRLFGQ